jgi:hypothetical protein
MAAVHPTQGAVFDDLSRLDRLIVETIFFNSLR